MAQVASLNVNTDRRLGSKFYEYFAENDKLGVNYRIDMLIEWVNSLLQQNTIVCLFEILPDVIDKITFRIKDAQIIVRAYNFSQAAFRYLIIAPPNISLYPLYHVAYTTDGQFIADSDRPATDLDKKANKEYQELTFGELFEKSFVCFSVGNTNIILTHQGLGTNQRKLQSQFLMSWIEKNLSANASVAILGDFNAFDPEKNIPYMEQNNIFLHGGFVNLVPFDMPTFRPYPYDVRHLISDKEKLKKFDDFVQMSKTPELTTEVNAKAFYDFCHSIEITTNFIALDNVYVKNVLNPSVDVISCCCNSDHAALLFNFDY